MTEPTIANEESGLEETRPERLGPYRIVSELGRGGMGVVYRAEDEQLRRPVALKVMGRDQAGREDARSRFLREARATAALRHDHIVTIYQVGQDAGRPYLAMEYLEGQSLEAWLTPDRRATIDQAVRIGLEIAEGLAAAHAAGLIHRDIKPANLWLEAPRGRVKILDFGLAGDTTGEFTALTHAGAVMGTPSYMSPEQAKGRPVDHRGDLFSLGCVLYRMLTGRVPFQGSTLYSILQAVVNDHPTPVEVVRPEVPARLASLVGRLLAKRPEDRPASASEVVEELRGLARAPEMAPTTVEVGGPVSPAASDSARPARRYAGIGVGILATLAAVGFAVDRFRAGKVSVDQAPAPAESVPVARVEAPPAPVIVDLMAMVDLSRDVKNGTWHKAGDRELRGYADGPDQMFSIFFPWNPPEEYRLRLAIERITPNLGPVAIALASGDERFIVWIDGSQGGPFKTGLGAMDGEPLSARSDGHVGQVLSVGVSQAVEITVRRAGVAIGVNGTRLYEWEGDLSRLGRPPGVPMAPVGLGGGYPADVVFRDVVAEALEPGPPGAD